MTKIQEITVVAKFGTPAYLYDAEKIRQSCKQLQDVMGEQVDIFYSMKANPNLSICALIAHEVSGIEVCSSFEIVAALQAGINPSRFIFVGPLKKEEDIRLCLQKGIYAIACESFEEIDLINQVAGQLSLKAPILLRINPSFSAKSALLKMGGKPSQFGIDDDQAEAAVNKILSAEHLQFLGIHIYNGTRILNFETLVENTEAVFALAETIQKKFQVELHAVDFGGGAGIPYFSNDEELDLTSLKTRMAPVIKAFKEKYPATRLIMESGRFLVGKSGMLVSKVYSIKKSKEETFVVTDGGTNCHMAAVGIGSIVRNNFPISVLGKEDSPADFEYSITGPLCTPNDLIAKKVRLPKVEVGDLIAVKQSGAYGPSASPVYFLSHGFPNEILIDGEQVYLIRRADEAEDLLKNQFVIQFNQNQGVDHVK